MEKSILLHVITPDDLKQIIKEALRDELTEFNKNSDKHNADAVLSRAEVSKLLKISMTTLWKWTKNNKLKSYGIGNKVFYKKNEVLESLIRIN